MSFERNKYNSTFIFHGSIWHLNKINITPPLYFMALYVIRTPIPVASRPNAWLWGRLLVEIAVSNPDGGMLSFVIVVYCQVEVSASGWSLDHRSPTECCLSDCESWTLDKETLFHYGLFNYRKLPMKLRAFRFPAFWILFIKGGRSSLRSMPKPGKSWIHDPTVQLVAAACLHSNCAATVTGIST
jgi:hypothetical protein